MSISVSDRLKIARYTGADPFSLGVHIDSYTALGYITSDTETAVSEQIELWESNNLDTKFTRISPNVKNYGAEKDPGDLRNSIRENLVVLLMLNRASWYESNDSFSVQIVRN